MAAASRENQPVTDEPLAHRLRPQRIADIIGQQHLLAPGKPLRRAIESGRPGSMILWGPPGCGKTTLAKVIANHTDAHFVVFSAVTEGVPRVREIIKEAKARSSEQATILFCDEIHRFNKAQQDAFLPSVESGEITLIGATTENPSFALNAALLSRARLFVLEALSDDDMAQLISRAWQTVGEANDTQLDEQAIQMIVRHAGGDARSALNVLDALWKQFASAGHDAALLEADRIAEFLDRPVPVYDRAGDQHYDLISALHKAVRGSDVEGALYWLARMLQAGEDPMYIARRMVRIATEDIGLADPRALTLALAARDSFAFLGAPEGELALAEALIFLASSPKSNRSYTAWQQATEAASRYPHEPVPTHLRNAPTRLAKQLGHGAGYRYDHNEGGFAAGQHYLPDKLRGAQWYEPTDQGLEKQIGERVRWWAEQRRSVKK